jgi:hypothetical protein
VPIEAGIGANAGGKANASANGGEPDLTVARMSGAKSGNRNAASTSLAKDYNPDQPRVPAGGPHGGEWSSESGASSYSSDSGSNSSNGAPDNGSSVISDATPDNTWKPGVQYVAADEDGEGEGRGRGVVGEGTPAQEARLAAAEANFQDALSRVHEFDPNWKPTPGLYETVEGEITNVEAQAKEAENRYQELQSAGVCPGPFAGESIPARGPGRDFTDDERTEINRIGAETGSHTCGTNDPETNSGNFVPDHQPPSALNPFGRTQRLYPQCLTCSRRQGGWITSNSGTQ